MYHSSQIPADNGRSKPVTLLIKVSISLKIELLTGLTTPGSERWKKIDRFNIFTVEKSRQGLNRFVTIQITSVQLMGGNQIHV
jgi:hypothetical protein